LIALIFSLNSLNQTSLKKKSLDFQSNILEYNGGSVLAMVGKNCVAIVSDKRDIWQYHPSFQKCFKQQINASLDFLDFQTL